MLRCWQEQTGPLWNQQKQNTKVRYHYMLHGVSMSARKNNVKTR